MVKRMRLGLVTLLIALVALLLVVPTPALADDEGPLGASVYSGTWGECTWSIDSNGQLTVSAGQLEDSGNITYVDEGGTYFPWYVYRSSIRSVSFAPGVILPENCCGMFYDCASLATVDVSGWDTSSVTSMNNMFHNCSSLTTLDVSGWETSSVQDMEGVFYGCSGLTSLDVSDWDTSSAQFMDYMFWGCSALARLDVSGWSTSSALDLEDMFNGCSSLTSLDVSGWNTYSVRSMDHMFAGCSSLTSLDVSRWVTPYVSGFYYMFAGCSSLTSLDVSHWDTSAAVYMNNMFDGCYSLTTLDVSGWNTSSVLDMGSLFRGCSSLATIDVSGWKTAAVRENMSHMFHGCTLLNALDLSGWDTSSVADMSSMFDGCLSLSSVIVGQKFDVSRAFPVATSFGGTWRSQKTMAWYTVEEIQRDRNGIADTYTTYGVGTLPGPRNYPDYAHQFSTTGSFKAKTPHEIAGEFGYHPLLNGTAFPLPGLEQTEVGGECCNALVPQGLCATDDYLLVTGYCSGKDLIDDLQKDISLGGNATLLHVVQQSPTHRAKKKHDSVIWVLDRHTGEYLVTIVLDGFVNHVGGITFDGADLWIASSGSKSDGVVQECRIPYRVVGEAVRSGQDSYVASGALRTMVRCQGSASTLDSASYNTYYDGLLWVGTNGANGKGRLAGFSIDSGGTLTQVREWRIPVEANGACFFEAEGCTWLAVSASPGRHRASHLYVWEVDTSQKALTLKASNCYRDATLPPMMEELCVCDGMAYVVFESGATRYSCVDGKSASNTNRADVIIDRICTTTVAGLLATQSEVTYKERTSPYRTRIRVACPVDVYLEDEEGEVVCSIVDDVADNPAQADGVSVWVEGEDKLFEFPSDRDYRVRIEATGEGTMDVTVTEFNEDTTVSERSWDDVPITIGDVYEGGVLGGAGEPVDERSWLEIVGSDMHTVSFDAGGGSGTMDLVEVEDGSTYTLPACGFTAPKGKVFDRWDAGAPGATITVTGDVVLTARWKDDVQLIPIYRMYNTKTSEHLWTKSKKEYDSCGKGSYADWRQENVAWYSPNMKAPSSYAQSTQGDFVYVWRLYDKGRTGDHIYLTYGAEMRQYLANGWVVDKGAGFWTVKKGTVVSERTVIPIYRAYNPKLKRGKHHYTPSKVEYDKICKNNGWKPEGVKFYVIKK